jgi:hypothetical protein
MITATPIRQLAAPASRTDRAETRRRPRPEERSGYENAAVGGEIPSGVRAGLERRHESVAPERDHSRAGPQQASLFPHPLPHHPGAADLGNRGEDEQHC